MRCSERRHRAAVAIGARGGRRRRVWIGSRLDAMSASRPNQETNGAIRMHSLGDLRASYASLSPPPPDLGRLAAIVCRRAPGLHEALERVWLTQDEGVPGDEWNRRPSRHPDAQLTVMRRDIAELIACGQPLSTSGDNLIVELDISAANLPVGTRLRIGGAVVEVTPKPHNG